jgi:phosphatidate phosphatase APP1
MIRHLLRDVTGQVEYYFDELKSRLEARLYPQDRERKILIIPYFGYATPTEIHIRARVLFDNGLTPATDDDKLWKNLLNTYRRINSDEIAFAVVQVKVNDQTVEITADDEGFVDVHLTLDQPLDPKIMLHDVQFRLLRLPASPKLPTIIPSVTATGQVILPPQIAQFGIISDLDDTVIQTDVLHLVSMARNTFLRNSRTRLPFSGVAGFYRALQNGTTKTYNPIYYVSSSPWNLYDLLLDFFTIREIPVGTMFLRNFGFPEVYDDSHKLHKSSVIEQLLETYPALPFVLVGDSGQLDPEIYTQIAERYPQRIRVIYIRDVTPASARDEQVKTLAERLKALGVDLLLVKDTLAAAEDAVQRGLIIAEAMPDIREERATDNRPPDKIDEVVTTAIDQAAEIVEQGVESLPKKTDLSEDGKPL